jgi:Tat protein secretion system quality control protein TatD with DNase activity
VLENFSCRHNRFGNTSENVASETNIQNNFFNDGIASLFCPTGIMGKELQLVRNYLDQRDFVAIGEIGIDLYWDKSTGYSGQSF